jgi:hypothetical protein
MRRFVITRFDTRRRMSHDIYEQIRARFGEDVCETRISENVSVAESPAANEDVFTHSPGSRGALERHRDAHHGRGGDEEGGSEEQVLFRQGEVPSRWGNGALLALRHVRGACLNS